MDFKVAGTRRDHRHAEDIKSRASVRHHGDALAKARGTTLTPTGKMARSHAPPPDRSLGYAPRISTIQIEPNKIGLLIGKGGETIAACRGVRGADDGKDEGQVLVCQTGARATPWSTASGR